MSHFSVTVCIEDADGTLARAAKFTNHPGLLRQAAEHVLEPVMAPWDENKEVAPYRSYEEGEASDHWLYTSLKRTADEHAAGTGILPYKPGAAYSTAEYSTTPEAEQRAEQQRDAKLFASLPLPVTWADIARLHNERYEGEERPMLVDSSDAFGGRAYSMTTYNPASKWDYWRVGGRWGGSLDFKASGKQLVVRPESGWDSPDVIPPTSCDGGRMDALDLEKTRARQADAASALWKEYQELVKGTPEAQPWATFRDTVGVVDGYTIDQARTEYASQPRVQVIRDSDKFRWHDDAISDFAVSREEYAERARVAAVPGFATVTLDGKWMAPGEMGWWAMTDATDESRGAYRKTANEYIAQLPDDAWLFVLDCHI